MTARPAFRQLALALEYPESFAREDFLESPANATALRLIEGWPDWPSHTVALVGSEGSGKSHLAAIWASASGARSLSGRALDVTTLPAALATGALVVEDVTEGRFDEGALFHLLNLVREDDAYLLLTARKAPATWEVGISDLASRLRVVPMVSLNPPDDVLLRAVMVKLFADRQLMVDESLIDYLLRRQERSFAAVRANVNALDRAALRLKRPLTRALAAEVLDGDET